MTDEALLSHVNDQFVELASAQARTETVLDGLSQKLSGYVEATEQRLHDLEESRLKHAELLASTTTSLEVLSERLDREHTECPNKEVKEGLAQVKTQGWIVKAMVGVTIIAALSGVFANLGSCNAGPVPAAAQTHQAQKVEASR